jgi:hypothetical protein
MTEDDGVSEKAGDEGDINALVQTVLRQSYLDTTEDLRAYAEKVSTYNKQKKAVREYLSALRKFKANVFSTARERGVDLCRANEKDVAVLTEVFEKAATSHNVGALEYELCVPDRVPAAAVKNLDMLEAEIAHWEERLNTVGDDAQLANVDLQNMLQKRQQYLQMLSNISKAAHDTAMSIIRNIKG